MMNLRLALAFLLLAFLSLSINAQLKKPGHARDFTHPRVNDFRDTMVNPVPSHLKTPEHNHPDISHPHDMDDFPTPGGDISHGDIVHQLKVQGVSAGNVEDMAAAIVRQHYSSGISVQNVDHTKQQKNKAEHYYDEKHPMSGINMEMVSSNVWKRHFKNIDRDQDGRVYIEEVKKYLNHEIATMTVDRVRYLGVLGGDASADYEGQKGVDKMSQRKKVFQRTLDNLEMDFAQVDGDKDGYLIIAEFGHLIQMHQDQALRRADKHLHVDMHPDFIHPSWRDDL